MKCSFHLFSLLSALNMKHVYCYHAEKDVIFFEETIKATRRMQMLLWIAGSQKEKQYRILNFCNCSTTVLHHAFVFSLQLYYKRISVPRRRDL